MLARALQGLQRTDLMIQALLDASRFHTASCILNDFQYCDLAEVVLQTVEELNIKYNGQCRFVKPGSIFGRWDSVAIHRALENLCANAAKYGFSGTPITVELNRDVDVARLSVHNEGGQIEEADQVRLFDPFYRGVSVEQEKVAGWGIGLTSVKSVAEAHGGTVAIESEEGRGTTFFLSSTLANLG